MTIRRAPAGLVTLVALVALLMPRQASADPWRTATNVGLAGFLLASIVDDTETAHCRGKSEALEAMGQPAICTEANPLLRGVMRRRGTVVALSIKGAANVGTAGLILAMRDAKRTRASAFAAIGAGVVQTWVAWHNAKALGISFTVRK